MRASNIPPHHARGAFTERTNLQTPSALDGVDASSSIKSWLAGPKRVQCKRPSNENDGGDKKRVKVFSGEDHHYGSDSDAYESDSDVEMIQRAPYHLKSAVGNSTARGLPVTTSRRRSFVSTLPILQSFVSSNKSDVFRCQSVLDGSFLAPPYTCAYSRSARSAGTPLLAVATEQGTVYVINTSKRNDWDPDPVHTALQPHDNGIFDVKWNMSDTLLATVSGDRLARISELETRCTVQTLRGHQGTAKCISWDPTHREILSTGGRDGMVCIWDLRVGENRAAQGNLHPVRTIIAAHEDAGPNGKRKIFKGKRAPMPRSVTGLIYSDANPHQLITSGSSDGILRCWDLRLSKSKSAKVKEPPCLFSSPLDPTTFQPSSRPRGIISLVDGTGPTTGLCFALGADSRIHTYERNSLAAFGSSYTHHNLQTNFYVKLAASPCGRWLATGGSGVSGSSFMFEVSNATRESSACTGVELKGHTGDAGGVDWASDMLSTCWDDGMVRVWRPDIETHLRCLESPEEQKWDWCWA